MEKIYVVKQSHEKAFATIGSFWYLTKSNKFTIVKQ